MRNLMLYPLFIVSILFFALTANALENFRHRMIVYLHSESELKSFQKKLPKKFKILSLQEEMIILSSLSELKEDDLKNILKLPMVRSAKLDEELKAQIIQTDTIECKNNLVPLPFPFIQTIEGIEKFTNNISCKIEEICPRLSMEKLWAQRAVDADLMNEYIEEHNLRKKGIRTPVAVLDSGFDASQLKAMMQGQKIAILAGVHGIKDSENIKQVDETFEGLGPSLVSDPKKDVSGHGTMVTSVIAGKNGMGVAPSADLSVYRVTETDEGKTSDAFLEYAVRYACNRAKKEDPKSTPIINYSWGGRLDEMGEKRDESNSPLMEFLMKKGCLVVKASGNSSFVIQDASADGKKLDDPFLRVAATSSFGGRAAFSSNGEVNTPGHNVFVQMSSQEEIDEPRKTCSENSAKEKATEGFVNGTSFAAPMTAGILSEVTGVLRSGEKFDELSPEKRIALLNRIISASHFAGTINGLRAVMIAEAWVKSSSDKLPSVLELQELLKSNQHPLCTKMNSDCQNSESCSPLCYKESRIRVSGCLPPNIEDSVKLFKNLLNSGSIPSAARALRTMPVKGNEAKIAYLQFELTEKFLNQLSGNIDWTKGLTKERQEKLANELDQNFAQNFLPGFLKRQAIKGNEDAKNRSEKILRLYLQSDRFMEAMNSGRAKGSEDILKTAMNRLQELRQIIGDKKFVNFIKELLEDNSPNGDPKKSLMAIRIMNAIHADPQFKALSSDLAEFDDSLFTGLDKNWIRDVFPRYEEMKEDYGLNIQFTKPYYDEFFDRMRPSLLAQLKKWDVDTISLTKLEYASQNAKILFNNSDERKNFLLTTALAKAIRARIQGRDQGKWNLDWLSGELNGDKEQFVKYIRNFLNKEENPLLLQGANQLFKLYGEIKEGPTNGAPPKYHNPEYVLAGKIATGPDTSSFIFLNPSEVKPFYLSEEERESLSIKAISTIARSPLKKNYSEHFTRILYSIRYFSYIPPASQERYKEAIRNVLEMQLKELKSQNNLTEQKLQETLSWVRPLTGIERFLGDMHDERTQSLVKKYLDILQTRVIENEDLSRDKEDLENWLKKK
jgi:hypothetical protein